MTCRIGDHLGQFEILGQLGQGGMGVVYRARDTRIEREVALKVLPASYAQDADRIARFKREALVLASLNHPNLGRLYDVLEIEGVHMLVLELIEGETLAEIIGRAPLTTERALPIFAQIARALEVAHRLGIVHRDLKPANIKIGPEGQATVIDFGIAKTAAVAQVSTDADTHIPAATPDVLETTDGLLIGTPAYMSPEQVRGGQVDERADIWAYGCCLYQALSGRLPFQGETATDTIASILRQEPNWEYLPPDLPSEAYVVLRRCLEKDVARRLRGVGDIALLLSFRSDATDENVYTAREWVPVTSRPVLGRPHWMLEERLGEGGFGEVWLASHQKTSAKRVFKFCRDPERIRGLKREVVLFRLLKESLGDRPDIAQIIDWQFDRPPYYLESEYTHAGDFSQWAQEQGGLPTLPLDVRINIVGQVARAVAAAHSVGILHKDIKPSNVLIANAAADGSPQAILTDFGIGYLSDRHLLAEKGITATGMTDATSGSNAESSGAGTRMYMAPELIEGKGATMQSDVYALGVLLYQSVAGDFTRSLAPGWERDIADPLLLEDIAGCVDRDISHRLQSASELSERLFHLESRRKDHERESRLKVDLQRAQEAAALARARRRRLVAVAIAGIVVSAILTLYALRESQRAAIESGLRAEAEVSFLEAHRERERAENNLQLARRAVDDFFVKIGRSSLAYDPSYATFRRGLIESSLVYHRQFVDAYRDEPSLRGDLAWTYFTMAAMQMQLEDPNWIDSFEMGLEHFNEILKNDTRVEDLGRMSDGVWHAGSTGGPNALNVIRLDPKRAFEAERKVIEVTESLVKKFPTVRGFRSDLGIDYHLMGHLVEAQSREKALAAHLRALELWSGLIEEDPDNIDYIYGVALSLNRIGNLHELDGRADLAMQHLEKARERYNRVLELYPDVPQFRETNARFLGNYGQALTNAGRTEEGIEAFGEGLSGLTALIQAYPGLTSFNALASDIAVRRGLAWQRLGSCDDAAADFQRAVNFSTDSLERITHALVVGHDGQCQNADLAAELAEQAVEKLPNQAAPWRALGDARFAQGAYAPSLAAFSRAAALDPESEKNAANLFRMAQCHVTLGDLAAARDSFNRAIAGLDALDENGRSALAALKSESEALLAAAEK